MRSIKTVEAARTFYAKESLDVPDEQLVQVLRVLLQPALMVQDLKLEPRVDNYFNVRFTHTTNRNPVGVLEKQGLTLEKE